MLDGGFYAQILDSTCSSLVQFRLCENMKNMSMKNTSKCYLQSEHRQDQTREKERGKDDEIEEDLPSLARSKTVLVQFNQSLNNNNQHFV